jgi:hemerythrin-like metal-binding protein
MLHFTDILITQGAFMFNKFLWQDRLSLKITKMDDQHKVLIKHINQLAEELNGDDYTKIQAAFTTMANYVVLHFREEEAFFDSHNFPGSDTHKAIHKKLIETVTSYENDIKNKSLDKAKFYEFLTFWLSSHIAGIDKKYSDFVLDGKKSA